jgi:hypothetical protein
MRTALVNAIEQDIIQSIDFESYSIKMVVQKVARLHGRPIRLTPFPMEKMDPLLYGCWMSGETAEYIFFEQDTAQVHQHHIIMHELSHILLGHQTFFVEADSVASIPLLMRTMARDEREEQEAEALATALQLMIVQRVGVQALTATSATAAIWNELTTSLHR